MNYTKVKDTDVNKLLLDEQIYLKYITNEIEKDNRFKHYEYTAINVIYDVLINNYITDITLLKKISPLYCFVLLFNKMFENIKLKGLKNYLNSTEYNSHNELTELFNILKLTRLEFGNDFYNILLKLQESNLNQNEIVSLQKEYHKIKKIFVPDLNIFLKRVIDKTNFLLRN